MIYVFLLGVVAFFSMFFGAIVHFHNQEAQNHAPILGAVSH